MQTQTSCLFYVKVQLLLKNKTIAECNCPYSKLLEVRSAEMGLTVQLNEFMLLNYTNFCQGCQHLSFVYLVKGRKLQTHSARCLKIKEKRQKIFNCSTSAQPTLRRKPQLRGFRWIRALRSTLESVESPLIGAFAPTSAWPTLGQPIIFAVFRRS